MKKHDNIQFERQLNQLINGWNHGDAEAKVLLDSLAYNKIFEQTRKMRKKVQDNFSIIELYTTSDMVHEIWCRLASAQTTISINTRRQFYDYIQSTMHSYMLDQQKKTNAQKRDANVVYLPDARAVDRGVIKTDHVEEQMSLVSAIDELRKKNPLQADLTMYKYYLGLTSKEIARILDQTDSFVEYELKKIKVTLKAMLETQVA